MLLYAHISQFKITGTGEKVKERVRMRLSWEHSGLGYGKTVRLLSWGSTLPLNEMLPLERVEKVEQGGLK